LLHTKVAFQTAISTHSFIITATPQTTLVQATLGSNNFYRQMI